MLLFLAGLAYWLACAKATRRRASRFAGTCSAFRSLRFASLQSALSVSNWITLGVIINLLLPKEVNLPAVLSVLLIGSVAGALAHIHAGLGVLETVFVLLLGNQVPQHTLLAALIVYRALYYLIPMVFAPRCTRGWRCGPNRRSRGRTAPPSASVRRRVAQRAMTLSGVIGVERSRLPVAW